jgi:histidyl-tRNA synthetase
VRFDAPRGTEDHLPGREPVREAIVSVAKQVARNYGYRRIITPTFEDTQLFQRTSGIGSDVVQKEMYSFADQAGRELTLRPEGTASVARAYVQHGLNTEPQPVKLYYISPMFRYARSQRGRFREFWQIGLEAIGTDDPALDAELIAAFRALSRNLQTVPLRLEINSIGDARCRPAYVERLRKYLRRHQMKLDAETLHRLDVSPLRVFDSKNPAMQRLLAQAPKITDHLCQECEEHFAAVRRYLRAMNIRPKVVPTLVRGLDYYTRTVWEFHNFRLGSQSSVCAGGRYDELIRQVGGRATPAVGWAAGIERIDLSLPESRRPSPEPLDVLFLFEDGSLKRELMAVIDDLRAHYICDLIFGKRRSRRQFSDVARRDPEFLVTVARGNMELRDRKGNKSRFRSPERLQNALRRRLARG